MMKILAMLLCVCVLFSLCVTVVLADTQGPMDSFEDDFKRGDIDGNDKLDAKDYMKLKRSILGTYTLTADEESRADVTLDGKVNTKDYMMLKRVILGTYQF